MAGESGCSNPSPGQVTFPPQRSPGLMAGESVVSIGNGAGAHLVPQRSPGLMAGERRHGRTGRAGQAHRRNGAPA